LNQIEVKGIKEMPKEQLGIFQVERDQEKHHFMKNQDDAEGTGALQRRRRVAFIYYKKFASFIKNDYDILSNYYSVEEVKLEGLRDIPRLAAAIMRCDISFTWFAGEHAFPAVLLSKALGKKSIVVAGGYDVANEPEIDYGLMRTQKSKSARMAIFVLRHADKVLAVSDFNRKEILNYIGSETVELVYNGVDCDLFRPEGEKDRDLIITVGGVTKGNLRKKGLEAFVKTAAHLPEERFVLVGQAYDNAIQHLKAIAPSNVEFAGGLPFDKLLKLYQKSKVYCQLSYHESFGLSLAEAMACECVPVATERGALPEVVGNTGFYVPFGDAIKGAEAIQAALESDLGEEARKRIKALFSRERRVKKLATITEELCSAKWKDGG
jgi:glycosyltransferase involved in cell wall biosynthesis